LNKKLAPLSNVPTPDDHRVNDPARKVALLAPTMRRGAMKYICLGYMEKGKFEGMTEGEQPAMFDTSFEYVDHLRANGHFAAGEALQPPETEPVSRYPPVSRRIES
jgi:hypothetical protein